MSYSLAVAGLALFLALLAQVCLRYRTRRRPSVTPDEWPAVTLLKPIKGVDPGLYENLVAFVEQDYPELEILVGVADPSDPACAVVRRLQRAYPHRTIRLVTGAPDIGLNPKVSNLAHTAKSATHSLWLVSDADVRPDPGYLRSMVRRLASGARLVHSLLAPEGEEQLGAALDNAQIASIAANVAGADALFGHACVIGKSMLFHAADFERIGGWETFKDVLAEDYLIGQGFQQLGMAVALADEPVRVYMPRRCVTGFFARHLRWFQMRRSMAVSVFLLEPLLHPTLALLVLAFERPLLALLGLALQAVLEHIGLWRLRGAAPRWWMGLVVPFKDVLVLAAWLVAALTTTVQWRGRRMRIVKGTRLLPVDEDEAEVVAGAGHGY